MPKPVNHSMPDGPAEPSKHRLRVPQARILMALMPDKPDGSPIDWPVLSRALLGVRAGYTSTSGTVTRALKGIDPGSSSGPPYLGLLALGFLLEEELDVDGLTEVNYQITEAGVRACTEFIEQNGALPAPRDVSSCTNKRYRNKK